MRVGCGPRAGSVALREPRSGEWAAAGRGGRGPGSGRPAGRLGLSRLLPGWRVGALGRRRPPPGVWTTARWTGSPRGTRARSAVAREALRRSRGVPSALRSVSCASRRGACGTWCPWWPHVEGPLSVSLSAESGRTFRLLCRGGSQDRQLCAAPAPPRPVGPAGRWRWRRAVRLEGPGSSETVRPRPGAAQSPEEDRLLGYPFWVGLGTSGGSVGLRTHFPEAHVQAWLHTVGDIGGTAPE